MALWRAICELCKKDAAIKGRVTCLYNTYNLPHKIRSTFASWIEATNWDIRERDRNEVGEKKFDELMREIDKKMNELRDSDLDMQLDLEKAGESLRSFQGSYDTFVNNIRFILKGERDILSQLAQDNDPELKRKTRKRVQESNNPNTKLKLMEDRLKKIVGKVSAVQYEQSSYILNIEDIHEKSRSLEKTNHSDTAQNQKKLQDELRKAMSRISFIRKDLYKEIHDDTGKLLEVLEEVWEERNRWLLNMKMEYAGLSMMDNNSIQILDFQFRNASALLLGWITMLDMTIVDVYSTNQINSQDNECDQLKSFVKEFKECILPKHLQNALVVESQPRILKVNAKKSNSFQIFVRMLGGLNLDQKHRSPKATISFLRENDLEKVNFTVLSSEIAAPTGRGVDSTPMNNVKDVKGICEIENGDSRSFQEVSGNSSFTARFYSLQLRNLQRLEKSKGNEYVTDFKYGFLIQTSITLLDKTYQLLAISLPVIVTSQTSQEIMAKGTLVWHAAFSDDDYGDPQSIHRPKYSVRDMVLWKDFAHLVECLYLKHAERELTAHHLHYLAVMLFKTKNTGSLQNHFDNVEVSYSQIMKEKLPKKDFSLWKWLQACLNLVSTLVKKEWKDGHIYGFISKDDAKRQLDGCQCGTFLLRFSESHIDTSQKSDLCGYLTVAVRELDPETGELKLFHVRDYLSPKDIEEKGLAPILGAMEVGDFSNHQIKHKLLKYLWPNKKSLSEIFPPSDQNKDKESNPGGYSGGQFSIEIFLSERRQPMDSGLEDHQMNPSSVISHMSSEAEGFFQPNLLDCMDEGNFNSAKPTAKVSPTNYQPQDHFDDFDDMLSPLPEINIPEDLDIDPDLLAQDIMNIPDLNF